MQKAPLILVIDDEVNNFEVIEILLDSEGYELVYLSTGQQAINLLDSCQPDLILLDVMMPQMNGIEFCQLVKTAPQWQHIPIITVTALNSKADLARCLAAGADDFIGKPVDGLELRARVRSMLRIKQQYDALQAALTLRDDMSKMLVHDLRNPLASIFLAAEILAKAEYTPERQRQKTEQILIAGRQLQSLIDSLLLTAKLESGKMLLSLEEFDLDTLCTSVIAEHEAIADQKKVGLFFHPLAPDIKLTADQILLYRVLSNLLSNAIKFAPSGSRVILEVSLVDSQTVRLDVIDSGVGIPKHLQATIFEKYEIGSQIKGTSQIGLGLAFCKLAIEAHAGRIAVEDNVPQGAKFSIWLPC